MNSTNKGGPAFPTAGTTLSPYNPGMSLRDYFAAKALQGVFASGNLELRDTNEIVAEAAYKIADAMIQARGA